MAKGVEAICQCSLPGYPKKRWRRDRARPARYAARVRTPSNSTACRLGRFVFFIENPQKLPSPLACLKKRPCREQDKRQTGFACGLWVAAGPALVSTRVASPIT